MLRVTLASSPGAQLPPAGPQAPGPASRSVPSRGLVRSSDVGLMATPLARLRLVANHVAAPADQGRGRSGGAVRRITSDELARHNTSKSMWIAVDGKVYDMTSFLAEHPGGKRLPLKYAGMDATEVWHSMHRPEVLDEYGRDLVIGVLDDGGASEASPAPGPAAGPSARDVAAYRTALLACETELRAFIDEENCHPIVVRLAWHDSGTFDAALVDQWPLCGGANGSIRFGRELSHSANAGLRKAVLYLEPFKERFPIISWADLIQLAAATAIVLAGGPKSPMRYGRVDVASESECPAEGRLPGAAPPFDDGSPDAATHLRRVFGRMGFSDSEIVALSGAHTLGRAFRERSGTVDEGYGASKGTRFTKPGSNRPRADGQAGMGMAGGRSWTERWLAFDNSYFSEGGAALLRLPTDDALRTDPHFRVAFDRYAHHPQAFFVDFSSAHAKLAELGSRFEPPGGIIV